MKELTTENTKSTEDKNLNYERVLAAEKKQLEAILHLPEARLASVNGGLPVLTPLEDKEPDSQHKEPRVRVDAKFPLTLTNRIRLAWMAISPRTHGVLRFGYDGTVSVEINQESKLVSAKVSMGAEELTIDETIALWNDTRKERDEAMKQNAKLRDIAERAVKNIREARNLSVIGDWREIDIIQEKLRSELKEGENSP